MKTQRAWREGDRVLTNKGERATIYMLAPDGTYCVLAMDDQFMPDGGQAFRTVRVESISEVPA